MKKTLISILLSLLIGSVFGYIVFRNIDNNIEAAFFGTKELTFFQAGIFLNKENAYEFASSFANATVIEENDFYRVYISILRDPVSVDIMKAHFDSQDLTYYLRRVSIRENNFTKELPKYEAVLLNATKDSTFELINEKILNLFKESA